MTGYTVHTGTSKKFISGWDRVFGSDSSDVQPKGRKRKAKASGTKSGKKPRSK